MTNHRGSTRIRELAANARQEARDAIDELRAVLAQAGIDLPSLGEDWQGSFTGVVLVELGRARPDVVRRIAELLRDGLAARAQQPS
ncbi:hypothetical protein P3T35_001533 [Kitasatospora sp. GP30]|uniref:hypothetical protein n=1 Tax=Kitasatospora sp. GP30 TaxID=3035084 RepID=UPI000CAA93FA|nr:hypothetical protein [Kitasatospora sp. GP30]MDH6139533.1 hypothetical protein [Kitasatospora sp. GP30]